MKQPRDLSDYYAQITVTTELGFSDEPSEALNHYTGRIKDENGKSIIGWWGAYILDQKTAERIAASLSECLDCMTQSTADYLELFTNDEDHEWVYTKEVQKALGLNDKQMKYMRALGINVPGTLLIFDRLELKPQYQRGGLGLRCMGRLIEHLGRGCDLVAIKPFPLQYDRASPCAVQDHYEKSKIKATEKLINHYAKLGFRKVKNTSYMVLNLQD